MKEAMFMSICCFNPTTTPNYTVCFPVQQVIPGGATQANPYYDFTNQISYWTYTIEIDPAGPELKDLSHWVLQVCRDSDITVNSFSVAISTDGTNFTPISEIQVLRIDPTTGITNVLKIDRAQLKGTTLYYRIAIVDPNFFDLAPQPGIIAIKAGTGTFIIDGNTCLHALPTPSVDCIKVEPTGLTLTKRCPSNNHGLFTVGDTISINLEVENTGSTNYLNVIVLDKVNIPAGVTIGSIITDPAATLTPTQATYTNQDILITWSGLTIPPGVTSLAFNFTILSAPATETVITNLDAGITNLSGTSQYICTIGVIHNIGNTLVNTNLDLCLKIHAVNAPPCPPPCTPCPYYKDSSSEPWPWETSQAQCYPYKPWPWEACKPEDCCQDNYFKECQNDFCFKLEDIAREAFLPFSNLNVGQIIECFTVYGISCDIIRKVYLPNGLVAVKVLFYIPIRFIDPNNSSITALRIFSVTRSITLCQDGPIDCSKSRVLSCITVVSG